MKTSEISELFESKGLIIYGSEQQKIDDLDFDLVISLFEKQGVLLFRDFDLKVGDLIQITDIYTEKYARDAERRKNRFQENNIHDVDLGRDAHTLHSEGSYSPACPEIIWFYCNVPPTESGETILCDGIKLWQSLSIEIKEFFLKNPLRFDLQIPTGVIREGKKKQKWITNSLGSSGYMDWDSGDLFLTQLQYAAKVSRHGNSLCFSNHLLAELGKDEQITNNEMMIHDGTEVPKNYLEEIKLKSEKLTYEHQWKKQDLVMIDNYRFMHGRRAIKPSVERDIVIVQTEKASFGYGSTLRKPIRSK